MNKFKFLAFILSGIFLLSCGWLAKSSEIKKETFTLSEVIKSPEFYIGKEIFWGGKIISCSNKENFTIIEILQFPINREGKIITVLESEGRFLIKTPDFLDCAVYTFGRFVRVKGIIKGLEEGKIENRPYKYIVIDPNKIEFFKEEDKDTIKTFSEQECENWHPWNYPCWEKSW